MKWVSVETRLPVNDDEVLCFYPRDGICVGYYEKEEVRRYHKKDGTFFYINDGWYANFEWAQLSFCSHWMPLPLAPLSPLHPDEAHCYPWEN